MHQYPKPPFRNGGQVSEGYSASHRAKDIVPRLDDSGSVLAIERRTGTNAQSGQSPGDESPNRVMVRDSEGTLAVYAHVDPGVLTGASVSQGTVIGQVDLSGQSSGQYVHISRLPPGDGTVDDVENREPAGEKTTQSAPVLGSLTCTALKNP